MVRLSGYLATGPLDFDSVPVSYRVAGNSIMTSLVLEGSLSALVTVLAETNLITLHPEWQVSSDNRVWTTCMVADAMATGTAGADSAVSAVIPAPASAYGWEFARMSIRVEGADGTSSDTYAISYTALKDQS